MSFLLDPLFKEMFEERKGYQKSRETDFFFFFAQIFRNCLIRLF